jgi:very-short-patch-repair endonuclease
LKSGRREHPTKGKVRTLAEKVKISSGLSSYWEEMSEVERDRRSEQARDRWNAMTEKQKESMKQKRVQAIQKSAREGSKLEKFLEGRLNDSGYSVRMHQVIIPAENLEIDLYIPDLKTIIEVDGPSHFLPIWGEDKLQKQINADLRKSGALLSKGYAVIRVKSLGQESLSKREQIAETVLDCLSKINKKFPPKSKRFIEVE